VNREVHAPFCGNPGGAFTASFAALGRRARSCASRAATLARYTPRTLFRRTSRLTVDALRPGASRAAISRHDSPAASPTAVSSRSHPAGTAPTTAPSALPASPRQRPAATAPVRRAHPRRTATSSTTSPARIPSQNAAYTSRGSGGRPTPATTEGIPMMMGRARRGRRHGDGRGRRRRRAR
jgi:hypothetical protein